MRTSFVAGWLVVALYYPGCTPKVEPTVSPSEVELSELWRAPSGGVEASDLYAGPWGRELAPDPRAIYTLVERKQHGTNPGLVVRAPNGQEWSVKQPPHTTQGAEGPIEVTLSRVLSAIGYHQPAVYFMPALTVKDGNGTRVEPGGRFRLKQESLKPLGSWSWQQNPFVGRREYQALLVILTMFNSSDLKNENNVLYENRGADGGPRQLYVVRDLGTALGETGKLAPARGNIDIFEREPFILGVRDVRVLFNYRGWHSELFGRISRADVAFAADLLGRLSDRQWQDAFRAGGYTPELAGRYIKRLQQKIAEARSVGASAAP